MEKRKFEKIQAEVSLLGYGCMRLPKLFEDKNDIDWKEAEKLIDYAYTHGVNYFDTAYPYHAGESERFIGSALKKYPRDSFFLASKLPVWLLKEPDDVDRILEEQLEKCQVDYFDFYLCHNLSHDHFEAVLKYDVLKRLLKKKEEGKIRRLGFSFHDKPEMLEKIIQYHHWDFAQIQLNYLDWEMQNAKRQYELLEENGIPCIVMEPVRGGALATLSDQAVAELKKAEPEKSVASWAIRYAASLPNVMTVLSGMSTMEQVKDNVDTMTNFRPLTAEDQAVLARALKIYRENVTIPCTGCRYCMDCPAGVDIPAVFSVYNRYAVGKNKNSFKTEYEQLGAEKQASNCVSCRRCMEHCPQGIDIPARMAEIDAAVKAL